ncbi:hypothetical protein PC129_g8569 [Phytophthora cactorum]|uniref:Uncharacterized protein n=1 Tax=Phytophthora cactorum TaxID=29920 RepID=A0A329STA9_9STRA|nr:hypothetical protein PC112_g5408 [Phytophthora cactorum]KAG2866082.1 hypothetical protein PC113_g3140 [Phytophthora cactorum]KAG2932657.1 hypothetical protein PC114_g1785 [Phytophthora cactorum]KAG2937004.1 hypothetical protein PC115_g4459 [Phytophthora cactorum]KAG2998668.1 hypothetical protein PC118_g1175 [Phytophthora cactorum]
MVSSYADAAWFKACEGYLVFCLWLLDRCYALSDVATPQSEKACHRVFLWFMLLLHVRRELGLGSEMFRIIEPPSLSVQEIIKYMGEKLLTLRLELQAESEDPNLGVGGKLERDVVAEVVEMATELLMSRATKEDKDALCQWLGILTLEGERLGDPLWEGQARDAADKACDRVGQFLELLDLYPSSQEEQKVEIPTISSEVEKLWTSELQQLQKLSSDEEEKRQELARGIEAFLRYDVGKWPECKVEVFGSSMSMFGSPDSDLDMCVLKDSSYLDNEFPGELQGFYYLKRLMERNVWDDHPAESCTDDKMDKLNKTYSQACAAVRRNYSSGDENAAFFDTQSILLVDALAIEYERFSKERKGRECSPEPAGPTACADIPPVEHHNKSIAFCEDREIAKIYHEKSIHEGELVDKSLPTLLLVFFKFYTTQFDCINHVVAVRSPDYVVQKTELWGNKAKTCRLSIQERRAISVGCSILMLNESSLKSYAVDMNSSTVGRVFWKLFA